MCAHCACCEVAVERPHLGWWPSALTPHTVPQLVLSKDEKLSAVGDQDEGQEVELARVARIIDIQHGAAQPSQDSVETGKELLQEETWFEEEESSIYLDHGCRARVTKTKLKCSRCSRVVMPCRCCFRELIALDQDREEKMRDNYWPGEIASCNVCGFIVLVNPMHRKLLKLNPTRAEDLSDTEVRVVQRARNEALYLQRLREDREIVRQRSKSAPIASSLGSDDCAAFVLAKPMNFPAAANDEPLNSRSKENPGFAALAISTVKPNRKRRRSSSGCSDNLSSSQQEQSSTPQESPLCADLSRTSTPKPTQRQRLSQKHQKSDKLHSSLRSSSLLSGGQSASASSTSADPACFFRALQLSHIDKMIQDTLDPIKRLSDFEIFESRSRSFPRAKIGFCDLDRMQWLYSQTEKCGYLGKEAAARQENTSRLLARMENFLRYRDELQSLQHQTWLLSLLKLRQQNALSLSESILSHEESTNIATVASACEKRWTNREYARLAKQLQGEQAKCIALMQDTNSEILRLVKDIEDLNRIHGMVSGQIRKPGMLPSESLTPSPRKGNSSAQDRDAKDERASRCLASPTEIVAEQLFLWQAFYCALVGAIR